mmetsp:Transcript_6697/g.10439  ORF Transcript_6697/g.10439 Transcript_6697/m.10439 type:complete len:205 (+) Transcript_6697:2387-3001(+)
MQSYANHSAMYGKPLPSCQYRIVGNTTPCMKVSNVIWRLSIFQVEIHLIGHGSMPRSVILKGRMLQRYQGYMFQLILLHHKGIQRSNVLRVYPKNSYVVLIRRRCKTLSHGEYRIRGATICPVDTRKQARHEYHAYLLVFLGRLSLKRHCFFVVKFRKRSSSEIIKRGMKGEIIRRKERRTKYCGKRKGSACLSLAGCLCAKIQ